MTLQLYRLSKMKKRNVALDGISFNQVHLVQAGKQIVYPSRKKPTASARHKL